MPETYTGVEQDLHASIDDERKRALPNAQEIQRFRNYVAGRQDQTLTKEQKEILNGVLKNNFCDNVCRRIVSTVSNRVKLERFDIPHEASLKYIQAMWTKNWLRMLSRRVHFTAIRDGDTYVALGWDNIAQRVTIKRELAWNGKRGVFMAFDDAGEPLYAVKEWEAYYKLEGDVTPQRYKRRVVWEEGRIGRFVLLAGGWQWFKLPEQKDAKGNVIREAEEGGWIWWTDNQEEGGESLGLPCVKFSRMETPKDDDNQELETLDHYGTGILAGGVLGNQDIINDDHFSILAANRFTAYQTIWAKGVNMIDANGNKVTLKLLPGTIIHVESKDADFGSFPAGDMSQLLATLEAHRKTAAQNTNTPAHTISGEWPSGVALVEADRPLVEQANSLCDSFGPSWASVANKTLKIAKAFGGTATSDLDTQTLITSIFAETESQDFAARVAIVKELAPYISIREALRLLNRYTTEQIEQIMRERKQEAEEGLKLIQENTPAPKPPPNGE